jgi:uncharacterized membrane protein
MSPRRSALTDDQMDQIVSTILRVGVGLAALVVSAGGIYFLAKHGGDLPHYGRFRGQPAQLRTLPGIFRFAFSSHSRGIIEIGLLLLIATPIARVVFSVIAFALQRDRTYVVITLIVLGVLVYNLVGGYH